MPKVILETEAFHGCLKKARQYRGFDCEYTVGVTVGDNQPTLAVKVDGYDTSACVAFNYDKASLKAAKRLVKTIERGMQEHDTGRYKV